MTTWGQVVGATRRECPGALKWIGIALSTMTASMRARDEYADWFLDFRLAMISIVTDDPVPTTE